MTLFHSLLLLLVVAIWGLNYVFVKIGLAELPPLFLCFTRFFLVSLPGVLLFKRPTTSFRWVILYSLIMFVLQFALMFSGIQSGISAGLSALLLQTQVFFSLFFAALIFKEKINRWQIGGALLSFSGIGVVSSHLEGESSLSGLLLVLSAAVAWGLGSVIVKKMGKTHSGSLLAWGGLLAWPPLLILSLFLEGSAPILLQIHSLSPATYSAILFIAFFSTAFGFGIWNWLVQLYPIGTVAPFTFLVPIFAMGGSIVFLNETLEPWKIGAALLVIGGLGLNFLGARRSVPAPNQFLMKP